MRVNVVYDHQGRILAAAEVAEGGDLPIPEPDERVAEFELPSELAEMALHEIVSRAEVDVEANQLTLRA